MKNTKDTVINMIAEQMGIPAETIEVTHHLEDDLKADTLHIVELIMCLEEEFEIEIDDDEFEKVATIQEVIDFVT
ncbi:MAG: acyl carrier protein [Deltaproteobacteria bacterium]|nr:MAG: acyl carrier protein [Deltaproteobacteria bacterium]